MYSMRMHICCIEYRLNVSVSLTQWVGHCLFERNRFSHSNLSRPIHLDAVRGHFVRPILPNRNTLVTSLRFVHCYMMSANIDQCEECSVMWRVKRERKKNGMKWNEMWKCENVKELCHLRLHPVEIQLEFAKAMYGLHRPHDIQCRMVLLLSVDLRASRVQNDWTKLTCADSEWLHSLW